MVDRQVPDVRLARRFLPAPLLDAVEFLFKGGLEGSMLAGGTALSGFYAGHRRSDDIDLFSEDAASHEAAVRAVEALLASGSEGEIRRRFPTFLRVRCRRRGHSFTIDASIFPQAVEHATVHVLPGGIRVASLESLLMMKAAALVGRASEKDLYDLLWLFDRFKEVGFDRFAELGRRLDAGLTPEGLIISLSGTPLSEERCGFVPDKKTTPKQVLRRIEFFRDEMIGGLKKAAEGGPAPPLGAFVKRIRRLSRRRRV